MIPHRGRPLAIATAAVLFPPLIFPMAAGLLHNTASFPRWWRPLDVSLAFVLAALVLVSLDIAQGKVSRQAEAVTYRASRILTHGVFAMLVAFFLFGNRIVWSNCLTGPAWRAWLLLYALPAWFTAMMTTPDR